MPPGFLTFGNLVCVVNRRGWRPGRFGMSLTSGGGGLQGIPVLLEARRVFGWLDFGKSVGCSMFVWSAAVVECPCWPVFRLPLRYELPSALFRTIEFVDIAVTCHYFRPAILPAME